AQIRRVSSRAAQEHGRQSPAAAADRGRASQDDQSRQLAPAQVRVRFADTHAMGVVHHANYLAYFEMGRVDALRQIGVEYASVVPIPVELTNAAFGGEAIGHLADGRVVFVPRALPGETALVRVQQERRDFARGELAGLAQTAPGRVDAPCPYYTAGCGGCSWQ